MDEKARVKLSKRMSYHLRHHPEEIGLTLEEGGWVPVEDLIRGLAKAGVKITREDIVEIVEWNPKQRFALEGEKIRANQGHSVEVDLQLEPADPPDELFHGTGAQVVPLIRESGLRKMSRHHVHLSADRDTAKNVGGRHGKPVVLVVDAAAMKRDGAIFYVTENRVWLVDEVPAKYLK